MQDSAAVFTVKFGKFFGGIAERIYGKRRRKILARYRLFQNKYLDVSEVVVERNDLQELAVKYDAFITGSDQVWSLNNAKVDGTYFLDFLNDKRKKISYAASFGGNLSTAQKKQARDWLLLFNHENISIRERQGAELVSEFIGYEPVVTLDPALLLNQEQWEEIAQLPKRSGYIFLCERVDSKSLVKFAKQLSAVTGLPIIQYGGHPWHVVGKRVRGLLPDEWLGYIQNAEYIVTNSFHGIVFALNYKKLFFVEMLKGKHEKTNSRLQNILEKLQLNNRVISDDIDLNGKIDYDAITPFLINQRSESISWLKDRLDASKED